MVTNIEYTNKESKKKICIPVDKKMIFIYGKNGSGKTTLSKSISKEDGYVFNEEFIYKNVYIIQNDGAKDNPVIKNNFSELLIGEEEIAIKKEIQKFETRNKEVKEEIDDVQTIINDSLLANKLSKDDNILTTMFDENFQYDYTKSRNEQFESYICNSEISHDILNDEDFNARKNQLGKHENLESLNKKIDSNKLLKAFLYSESKYIDKFNQKMSHIKSCDETIRLLEKISKEKNVDSKYFSTIKDCLNIQKETKIDRCFLCGTENVQKQINEWNKLVNDSIIITRDKFRKDIKAYIENASSILDLKEIYSIVAPKTVKCIEEFVQKMYEIDSSIDKKTYSLLTSNNNPIDSTIMDIQKLKESIRNYLLKPYEKRMMFLNSLHNKLIKDIKTKKENLEQLLSKNSERNEKSINSILAELGLGKEIMISVDKYGGSLKYKMDVRNGNLNTLSDGQKHKLALAVFLNYIKDKDTKNKLVVFDDPVISLDELGYHLFKSYIIKNVMDKDIEKSPYLIILTHNFGYLYVQISNIISNKKFIENSVIYRLTAHSIHKLDFHYFKLDDIALFKECLSKMQCQHQLIEMSLIYFKIFRIFLDLTLRIKGIPDLENPAIEIKKLNKDKRIEKELKGISQKLCLMSRAKKIKYECALDGLIELKKAIVLLGYEYILDEEIERARSLSSQDIEYENDIFFILREINDILKNSTHKNYVDYLRHPRISFTQNIISTSMDK